MLAPSGEGVDEQRLGDPAVALVASYGEAVDVRRRPVVRDEDQRDADDGAAVVERPRAGSTARTRAGRSSRRRSPRRSRGRAPTTRGRRPPGRRGRRAGRRAQPCGRRSPPAARAPGWWRPRAAGGPSWSSGPGSRAPPAAGRPASPPGRACRRPTSRRCGRGRRSQWASQVPMPRPRWLGRTAVSARSTPISSAYATRGSPSNTPIERAPRSWLGLAQSLTMSASSISTVPDVLLLLGGHQHEDVVGVGLLQRAGGEALGQVGRCASRHGGSVLASRAGLSRRLSGARRNRPCSAPVRATTVEG